MNVAYNNFMGTHELTISMLKYCVYVLYSLIDSHFYIGFSSNLEQRLAEHASGKSASTASRRPFRLIFCEYYFSKSDALRRERYFKTTAGKRTLKLMLQRSIKEISNNSQEVLRD
jgi:putative endonuclease